jgi:uncharacterized protein (DUF1697 family)
VVFLRGVNVGGQKTFRPSVLAGELREYDVVNIGAAGTFVVRKPPAKPKMRAELLRRLPFKTEIIVCQGRDLLALAAEDPFKAEPLRPDIVRFVTILSKPRPIVPIAFPADDEWLLRILASKGKFVFGAYRRRMKAIRYLTRFEKQVGVPVTTRNWNTITAIVRALDLTRRTA